MKFPTQQRAAPSPAVLFLLGAALLTSSARTVVCFQAGQHQHGRRAVVVGGGGGGTRSLSMTSNSDSNNNGEDPTTGRKIVDRRSLLATVGTAGAGVLSALVVSSTPPGAALAAAAEGNEEVSSSFAALAERAKQISTDMDKEAYQAAVSQRKSDKSAYDFDLPYEGKAVKFADLIGQETSASAGVKVKAVLVVNMKQDDPVARKTIPELISIASKYTAGRGSGSSGAVVVVACPTDQGYYEPDTSALIRLKLASEYGYGINPATIVTDKVNLLGSGAHPFWRWLESTCRVPTSGLGRVEGNFEKFLIDGLTGQPLRRYPRNYAPQNIESDIEAVINGRPLPPARANFLEEWRMAAAESERDVYRFQKGLNWYDQ